MSIFEYFGLQKDSKCGYCKEDDHKKLSHGMWAHKMSVQDYQDLLDRGWRRSGEYCYKPVMEETCCPQYTIRCRSKEFVLTPSQRRVLNKMNRYLKQGKVKGKLAKSTDGTGERTAMELSASSSASQIHHPISDASSPKPQDEAVTAANSSGCDTESTIPPAGAVTVIRLDCGDDKTGSTESSGKPVLASVKRPVPPTGGKRGKDLRRERKLERLRKKGIDPTNNPLSKLKILEDYFEDARAEDSHKLELKMVPVASAEFRKSASASYQLFKKYQMAIHGDDEEDAGIRMYTSFLVQTPLEDPDGLSALPQGSFHHQYYLDGQLVAVGVLDLLPSCVSSKYFFYDPAYDFLSLGVYSALREIALTRQLCEIDPRLQYYYMGYYLHNCTKMKYKGGYYPSDLLCPVSYAWCPIENCRPKLDEAKYARLDDSGKKDHNGKDVELNSVNVLFRRTAMTYRRYKTMKKPENAEKLEVAEYAGLAGKLVAHRALLYRKE